MIKINSLKLKNFKGIRNFELELNGQDINVYGDNATGKTTLYDAFLWLLFDKDSLNRSNFGIKTLDKAGQVIHGLDHEVKAVLDIDGKQLTLRKVYYEKWIKQKGSAKRKFSGHTTDYFINSVPVKKKEYDEKIIELMDEHIFRLLTDPRYFNEQLHWEERRKLLLEICGDITDKDVIESDKKLAKLSVILENRSIEDHKKVIAARKKEINDQLDRIPIRIDEVYNSMPDIKGLNFDAIQEHINEIQAIQDEYRKAISRIESGGEIAEKEKQLAKIDAEMFNLKIEHNTRIQETLQDLLREDSQLTNEYRQLDMDLAIKKNELEKLERTIKLGESEVVALREKWHLINSEEFEYSQDTVCPTCGQPIPEYQLQKARDKAIKAFNLKKSQSLESVTKEGKIAAAQVKEQKEKYNVFLTEYEDIKAQLNTLNVKAKKLSEQIENIESSFGEVVDTPEYKTKLEKKEQLQKEINILKAGNSDEINHIQKKILDIDVDIRSLQSDMAKKEQVQRARIRIKELEEEEEKLAEEFEKLEGELYLIDQFVKTKVNLLESRINNKFNMSRFKLFDVQVNGGVVECCETVYDGVPYGDLNNAARINIGLDIINTLSDHYGFEAPIFVDNAESVTDLVGTSAQMIRLIVSESDKELRVEKSNKKLEEAV